MKTVSRRNFLTIAGASFAGAGLTACGKQSLTTPAPAPSEAAAPASEPALATAPPAPTASATTPPARLRIFGGDRDAWAWETTVRGAQENVSCQSIQVLANGKAADAAVSGGSFRASAPVKPGENRVSAACPLEKVESEAVMINGRLRNAPVAVIDIRVENGKVLLDGSGSQPAPVDPAPIQKYAWSGEGLLEGQPETKTLEVTPPAADGEYYLSLEITDEAGRADRAKTYFRVEAGQPKLDDWTWENTDWIEDAVVYGVIPRKFGKGFESIAARFEQMQDLGINAIWLAPINVSPPGDYGYGVVDYFNIRESYGTKEEFQAFVQDAHAHGIRVLMDFVPNHSSKEHPYFLDAKARGKESHYWDYYDRDENGNPTHYFDWVHLPNLNYNNPEVDHWITEAMSYWVREFDVDGYRVDACWGVKERKPDFWPRLRAALKRIKPEVLILAEASARDEYYFTEGFDAAYDWTSQLGKWAWELVFDDPKLINYNLRTALTNNRNGYHEDALIFRFLNNNDTGGRFISKNGLALTKVATVLLLTLPGIPCVYTGDEIGAQYTPYGDPLPLNWEKDPNDLYPFHKKLIHLRHDVPQLHSRKMELLDVKAAPGQQVFAYLRFSEAQPDQPVLVLLNFAETPASAVVELPEPYAGALRGKKLRDLLAEDGAAFTAEGPVAMEPSSARVLAIAA